MFKRKIDLLTIGDITTDAYIRLKEADIHCRLNHKDCEICMKYGDKIPFEYVKVIKAVGNSANASVCATKLGLKSAIITDVGKDQNGYECIRELKENNVITSYITMHDKMSTNYHFVLWYQDDRTILVNHIPYNYSLPKFPEPSWLYLTSLGNNSQEYHEQIKKCIVDHKDIKIAFQPGTFQIRQGIKDWKDIYLRTDVFIANLEEYQKILATEDRDPKILLKKMIDLGPKIALLTDGIKGSYMYDDGHYYHIPMYPDARPPVERTGCGDAYSSTFISALILGKSPLEAFVWAPVNPMSVAQFIGPQQGLLSAQEIDWWLRRAPEGYRPKEI
jgi:sugar/nucleoside kinase (ribokinase family)